VTSGPESLETLAAFPARLAIAALAAEPRPRSAGEWSPSEVARHLVAVERVVWQARFAQLAVDDDPHWDWTEPGPTPELDGASLQTILASFADARGQTVALVRALDAAGWARHGTHATYGVLDVAGLLRLAVGHDDEHVRGIAGY
jgi:DinB superfamily